MLWKELVNTESTYNYCNRCGSDTHHSFAGECNNLLEYTFEGHVISSSEASVLLECKICKQTCIRVTRWHSEDGQDRISFYPPRSKHKQPLWIDNLAEEYGDIVRQIYPVLDSGSYSLALIGIRALLDLYISRHSDVSNDFKKMLDQLGKLGALSAKQQVTL